MWDKQETETDNRYETDRRYEKGDMRQSNGDVRQRMRDGRQQLWDRRCEITVMRQETWDRDTRLEKGDIRHWDMRLELEDVIQLYRRQKMWDRRREKGEIRYWEKRWLLRWNDFWKTFGQWHMSCCSKLLWNGTPNQKVYFDLLREIFFSRKFKITTPIFLFLKCPKNLALVI